jgi:N-acetylmuramoyl-L-alanine amidase
MWNWIKKLFKKKEEPKKPVETKPNIPEIPDSSNSSEIPSSSKPKKKVVLIVGHSPTDSGAIGWNKVKEFDYNLQVAKMLNKSHGLDYIVRGKGGIAGAALEALSKNPDLILEMHLNAYNGKAKGCCALVLKADEASAAYARKFTKMFCDKFDRVLRSDKGVLWVDKSARGGFSLSVLYPAKAAILLESFFIDNPDEWVSVEDYYKFMVEFIETL